MTLRSLRYLRKNLDDVLKTYTTSAYQGVTYVSSAYGAVTWVKSS